MVINDVDIPLLLTEDSSDGEVMDRDQATALYMAGRHLPSPIIPSQNDRVSLISEASKIYEAIGDKKSVQSCRKILMQFEDNKTVPGSMPVHCS